MWEGKIKLSIKATETKTNKSMWTKAIKISRKKEPIMTWPFNRYKIITASKREKKVFVSMHPNTTRKGLFYQLRKPIIQQKSFSKPKKVK